ncbi:uncharacterized protein LOC111321332 [Stylophora pistillata]|uniref:uncharacterized protein LOC111321332 n=1 Tax=Stylophora pistillata TaxID=50429 RepID=UPI000C041A9D|nr:uncharacterized protein LOC111321332 [Stylophora pistillata]
MSVERVGSPREGLTLRVEDSRSRFRKEELDIEKLRTFSRSLDDITSETLYSKWKRARGEGTKSPSRRGRSISLITPPNILRQENQKQSKPARKNSFHVLQENVFRPRGWTIAASPMEVINEHFASQTLDVNNNNDTPALDGQDAKRLWGERRRNRKQFKVTLQIPQKQHRPPTYTGAEITTVTQGKKYHVDRKRVIETASEVFIKPSQVPRFVPESSREDENPPIVAHLVGEVDDASITMEDSFAEKPFDNLSAETVKIELPQQSVSMPASPNFPLRKVLEHAWEEVTKDSFGGLSKDIIVQDASEMTASSERSKASKNTFSLGCTYAVVSQPTRANKNTVKPTAQMNSTIITKEQRAELEEEFQKLKKVSLELDRAESEEKRCNSPNGSSGVNSKDILEPQPFRRFSELNNPTVWNSSSQSTARAILQNITDVAHKTEKERIQDIEWAFEWIRKELAELRAQDKDIMRTFTKIQAGIRKIKLQRALSGALDEPYECDIVHHSVNLSASFSYVPLVKELHNTFPRRASAI